jgi:DNA primase
MPSNPSAKEEIKRAADIVQVIGQFVQLKKAGKNFMGLCPFHAEKDPSFTVSPDRQMFHCFGCKKGGDIISFWMEYHSSTFQEAIRDLAERYQITLPEKVSYSEGKKMSLLRKSLFEINEKAAVYFQGILNKSSKGKGARDYLARRSISEEIISQFRIGFAPDEWDGVTSYLRAQNIQMKTAVEAGLIVPKKSGGYYDRFRGRVIFPIFDIRGQVIGFGGRVLDDSLPKYLNSPETPVFKKGETLYGLNIGHRDIRNRQRTVIVEGYMDCLSLRANGINEVVATLGTAITDKHVRRLKGYANEAVVLFDSDQAGLNAALKSLPVFLNEGFSAKAVRLPDGYDPDKYVNEKGVESLGPLLDNAKPMFDFYIDEKLNGIDLDIEGKVKAVKDIIPVLEGLSGDTQKALYVKRLSERIGVKEEVILAECANLVKYGSVPSIGKNDVGTSPVKREKQGTISDMQLLNLVLFYPNTIPRLFHSDCRVLLTDPRVKYIMDVIFSKFKEEVPFTPDGLLEDLKNEEASALVRDMLHEPFIVFSDDEVELALSHFERHAERIRLSESIKRVNGDIEALNQILEMKTIKERQEFQ